MPFSKPTTEIIKQRFSCRSYIRQPIEAKLRRKLEQFAAEQSVGPLGGRARFEFVAGKDNDLQELKGLGTYGIIKGATGFYVGATNAEGEHLEDFGYLMEKLILYATDLGLGTCWLGGSFTKTSFAKKLNATLREIVPSVVSVGYIAKNPGYIDKLIRKGAKADTRLGWDKLFFESSFSNPLSSEKEAQYASALEMVRLAPSASNRQPWRLVKEGNRWHFFLQRSQSYTQRKLVKLYTTADLQRIDMGIAMCHFELTLKELGIEGKWSVADPRIIQREILKEYTATWTKLKTKDKG